MLNDVLSAGKAFFDPGAHTELRGQLNRSRRTSLLSGNVVTNARSDISGVSPENRQSFLVDRASRHQC